MIDRQYNYTPQIIKKSNLLIEKHNYLTAVNHKILNCVIGYVQKYQISLSNNNLEIPVRKVINLVGKKEVYRTELFFSNIGRNLVSNILELIEPTKNQCDITSLISRFKLEKGIIHIKITDEFKDLINTQRDYTRIDLNKVNECKSKHTMVLYEYYLMKLKYNTHHSKDKTFTITKTDLKKLKKLLCSNSKSYNNTNLFIHKILKPAIEEINAKTDLNIVYQNIKCEFDNKTIVGFEFTIKQNEIKQIVVEKEDLINFDTTKKIYIAENQEILKPTLKLEEKQSIEEEYPPVVQEIINIGIKPASKVLAWYKEDNKRLIANWQEVNHSIKYKDKPNIEKVKLLAHLWKVKANFLTLVDKEKIQKETEYQIKQQVQLEQQKRQEQEVNNKVQQQAEKAFAETKIYYDALEDEQKIELLQTLKKTLNCDHIQLKKKFIDNEKYKKYDNLGKFTQSLILNRLGFNEIIERNIVEPPLILSFAENEKLEAKKAMLRLSNSPELLLSS